MFQEVKPYQTPEELVKDLDNGGRFYNIFTKADDNVVTSAELVKAAGVISNEYLAFLFLEMAQHDLQQRDRTVISDLLEPDLLDRYQKARPNTLSPSKVKTQGEAGRSLIITGYPSFVEDKESFSGLARFSHHK